MCSGCCISVEEADAEVGTEKPVISAGLHRSVYLLTMRPACVDLYTVA